MVRLAAALQALPGIAQAAGVEDYALCPMGVVGGRDEGRGARRGRDCCAGGQAGYPAALLDVPDAPPILWAQGDVGLAGSGTMVALVGARNASSLGLRMARRLGEGLGAAGLVVVSGLARGVDAEAHQAALGTGTVAVQAGGVDHVYPAENAGLAAEIAAKRLPRCRNSRWGWSRRRGISRCATESSRVCRRAVVVVEAAAKSGSLITAEAALEQGREVFAVPGHPFDARAYGL